MHHTILITTASGGISECNSAMNYDEIVSLLGFEQPECFVISRNGKILKCFYDKKQYAFGTNIYASKLFDYDIHGNCVLSWINNDLTIKKLNSLLNK